MDVTTRVKVFITNWNFIIFYFLNVRKMFMQRDLII